MEESSFWKNLRKRNVKGDEDQGNFYKIAKFSTTPIKDEQLKTIIDEKIMSLPEKKIEAVKNLIDIIERIKNNIEDFEIAFEALKELLEEKRIKPINERTEIEKAEIEKIIQHGKWLQGQLKLLPITLIELERALQNSPTPILNKN